MEKSKKRMSVKLRITLWFAVFMILLCAVIFLFVALISNADGENRTVSELIEFVTENAKEVEYDEEDDEFEIDDSFSAVGQGMYCAVLDNNGTGTLAGGLPLSGLYSLEASTGGVRRVTVDGMAYLVYDAAGEGGLIIRGVAEENGGAIRYESLRTALLIALPILLVLAVAGGYLVAWQALRPINKITATAVKIGESGDLSRRIEPNGGRELQRLAEAFNRTFERLEANFEAERRFTSDASHELRTPLTVIMAQCEYAVENAKSEAELYEALEVISRQSRRMSYIIDSLLTLTRIEQKTESFEKHPVNLSRTVESVCEEQRRAGIKNIELCADIQPNLTIQGDETLLARLAGNLIRNAYKYGNENGRITVTLKESGGATVLTVADNGVGISPDDLPHIWDRFYRADKVRGSSGEASLGLGLSMVRQIASLHGGTVGVRSTLGRGSEFTVTFR